MSYDGTSSMQRTLVIGDVHGCVEELQLLLRACGAERGDRVILAGDLVGKGPDSQGVVQLAREQGALGVLGNHDAYALEQLHRAGGEPDKVRRRGLERLGRAEWAYLQALPLFLRLGPERKGESDTVVVHAGLVPGVSLESQQRDHLLNLRSLAEGTHPTSRLLMRWPWAAAWQGPERVVFGHDAVRGLQQQPMATGLDTGCVYGRHLTALALPERRLVQVAARRRYAAA
jgi:hypothetical protein